MCSFGAGQDLCIGDKANENNSSFSNPSTYEIPQGKDKNWLAGSLNFKVIEIEVYTVKLPLKNNVWY